MTSDANERNTGNPTHAPNMKHKRFAFDVYVDCETLDQARQVLAERLDPDEDYGFEYIVSYGEPNQ